MRRLFPLSILVFLLVISAVAQSGRRIVNPPPPREPVIESPVESAPARLSRPVADLNALPENILERELQALDKGSFRLSDFGGKVLVVNLWATWCGPCRREVPDYEKVRREFAGKAVEFIGLSTEDPRASYAKVKQFARDFNFGFRLGWADRETARVLMNGRSSIPQTLVIAANGHIVSHWNGYSGSQSGNRLRDAIESALSETPSTQPQR